MSTTLHLLLGGRSPHSLPTNYIIRKHMMALHRALLEWLILGTPPTIWMTGCLHENILPPRGIHTWPYACTSIAATNLLPKGPMQILIEPPAGNINGLHDSHRRFTEAQPHPSTAPAACDQNTEDGHSDSSGSRVLTHPQHGQSSLPHRGPTSNQCQRHFRNIPSPHCRWITKTLLLSGTPSLSSRQPFLS